MPRRCVPGTTDGNYVLETSKPPGVAERGEPDIIKMNTGDRMAFEMGQETEEADGTTIGTLIVDDEDVRR